MRRCSRLGPALVAAAPALSTDRRGWVGGCAAAAQQGKEAVAAPPHRWGRRPRWCGACRRTGRLRSLYCAARSRDCSGTKRRGRRTRPASVGSAIGLPVWGLRSLILGDAIHHPICSGRPCCLLYCFGACNRMHSGKGTREDVAFCFVTAVAAGYLGGHVRKGSRSLIVLTCCRSERGMGVWLFVRALIKTVRDKERLGPIMHESDSI